jgi:hypothetical protein
MAASIWSNRKLWDVRKPVEAYARRRGVVGNALLIGVED